MFPRLKPHPLLYKLHQHMEIGTKSVFAHLTFVAKHLLAVALVFVVHVLNLCSCTCSYYAATPNTVYPLCALMAAQALHPVGRASLF